MFNCPYEILGVSENCGVEDAKKAYRKLAMEHHPDRGGDEIQFKKIKAAWEKIENNFANPKPKTVKPTYQKAASSFNTKSAYFNNASPASGYEARGTPPPMPRAVKDAVTVTITDRQAFEGCVVPFIYGKKILYHTVLPGIIVHHLQPRKEIFPLSDVIGDRDWNKTVTIEVTVVIKPDKNNDTPVSDKVLQLKICALALFTGGVVTVLDAFDEKVTVKIPSGHDPNSPILVYNAGYGDNQKRGNLIINIVPIFKRPEELTISEMKQLYKLNEMTK